jgi:hypothetical protein
MVCADQLSDAGRCHTDPEFLCLDLFWDAKLHGVVLLQRVWRHFASLSWGKEGQKRFF